MKWFKYRMTAPPMAGYIEAESKEEAHKLMESNSHFAGYNNGANTVTLKFATEDEDKVKEWVSDVFRPNEAVKSNGEVVHRGEEW